MSFRRVALACLGTLLMANAPGSADEDEIVWIDRYDVALAEAKATGKPIFLEFRCVP